MRYTIRHFDLPLFTFEANMDSADTGLHIIKVYEENRSFLPLNLTVYALPRDGCTAVCRQDERVVPCVKAGNKPESHAHIGRIEPIGTGRTG